MIHIQHTRWHSIVVTLALNVVASPVSTIVKRQDLTKELCANQEALPDSRCWDLPDVNIPSYLNDQNTGWIHTTPTCADLTRCCLPKDDGWTTCYLRLALPGVGQDCTTLNDHPCTPQTVLASDLDGSIKAQVRNTVLTIYGIHDFFSTYYRSLNDAYTIALSKITDITVLLDPNKATSMNIFMMLAALSVGFAFLTAPTFAAAMLESQITSLSKGTMQSFAIGLQQAPGIARSMWPAGDDLSRTIQIGALQEKVSNLTVELGNTLSRGLHLIMTDASTFVAFADHGRYINNPPLDPNEIKGDLAVILQTYLVSESLAQNNWWALPMGMISKEAFDNLHDPEPICTVHGCSTPNINIKQLYWSPQSTRYYRLQYGGSGDGSTGTTFRKIVEANWADLPLLFDGAYNCTWFNEKKDPQTVHVNFDGTLDIGCVSKLPMKRPCGSDCPHTADDGSCPFEYDADCSPPKGGASVHGGIG